MISYLTMSEIKRKSNKISRESVPIHIKHIPNILRFHIFFDNQTLFRITSMLGAVHLFRKIFCMLLGVTRLTLSDDRGWQIETRVGCSMSQARWAPCLDFVQNWLAIYSDRHRLCSPENKRIIFWILWGTKRKYCFKF